MSWRSLAEEVKEKLHPFIEMRWDCEIYVSSFDLFVFHGIYSVQVNVSTSECCCEYVVIAAIKGIKRSLSHQLLGLRSSM